MLRPVVPAPEHRGTGDQRIGAGGDHARRGLRRNAAVHLDVDRPPADHGAQLTDLVDRRRNEALAAEAGIDRHHQNEVDQVDEVLDARSRRARVERHADLLAERADRLQRAVHVRAGLDMHGDDVGAGLGEGFQIGVARADHQMHVEGLLADAGGSPSPRRGRWRYWARNGRPSRRHGSSRRRRPRPRAPLRPSGRSRPRGSTAR